MDASPEQLRDAIGRQKIRSILAAGAGAIAWFLGFITIAKFIGPLDRSWMLPVGATFLIGGLCAMIAPVILVNRLFAPRCPSCQHYLCSEEIADSGECPRCRAKLFSTEHGSPRE